MNIIKTDHSHRTVTPVTFANAHRVQDMNPCWGLMAHAVDPDPGEVPDNLPPDDVLATMERELLAALRPCADPRTGEGMEKAAAAAGVLIASYPQQDRTSATYAELVASRLARCPEDLLPKVIHRLVDEEEFRPPVAKVHQAVQREVAKRQLLLARVQAARRYWAWLAKEEKRLAQIAADRKAAAERRAARPPEPPAPREEKARTIRPAYLSPGELAALRTAKPKGD